MSYDKTSPNFWRNIRKGAFLELSDEETLLESMEDSQGADGVTFELLEDPQHIVIEDVCEFYIYNLEAKSKTDIILIATIIGDDVELKAYFEDADIVQADDRKGHVDRGDFWIFEEPEDVDDFEITDLEFAQKIEFDDSTYEMKRLGTMHGSFNGEDGMMASIAEYTLTEQSEDNETNNSELMVYEYGDVDDEDGGYLSVLFGYTINLTEVDILQ